MGVYLRCPTAGGAPSPGPSWGLSKRSPPRWWLGSWGWSCDGRTAWWCWSCRPRGLLWQGSYRDVPFGGCSAWRPRRARAEHESSVREKSRERRGAQDSPQTSEESWEDQEKGRWGPPWSTPGRGPEAWGPCDWRRGASPRRKYCQKTSYE